MTATTLAEHQFELLPSMTAQAGLVFGIGADLSVDGEGGFDTGDDDWEDQDDTNPRRGGWVFGRDLLAGPTWAWKAHVNRGDLEGALETLSAAKTAWRAKAIRNAPGAVLPLRYQLGGRTRRVFGRPRRFAAPPDNKILSGYIPVTTDFKCVDGYTYDDVETVVEMSLQFASEGGFIFGPSFTFPFTTLPPGTQTAAAVVGGDADTFPVIRFNGPVVNPVLEHDDWSLGLELEIATGDYVEVDLRPWAMTALYNGSASVGGAIRSETYLSEMSLAPGGYVMTFRGEADTSAATCTVTWANAYNGL